MKRQQKDLDFIRSVVNLATTAIAAAEESLDVRDHPVTSKDEAIAEAVVSLADGAIGAACRLVTFESEYYAVSTAVVGLANHAVNVAHNYSSPPVPPTV